MVEEEKITDCSIVICEGLKPFSAHVRTYNKPTYEEVYVLMPEEEVNMGRDIQIRLKDGSNVMINEINPTYDCMQYPLLFPEGTKTFSKL